MKKSIFVVATTTLLALSIAGAAFANPETAAYENGYRTGYFDGRYGFPGALSMAGADGDGDGLPDRWELVFGTDPADPADAASDHDGDGLSALGEWLAMTSPVAADTDGDGIPDGWEVDNALNATDGEDAETVVGGGHLSNLDLYRDAAGLPRPAKTGEVFIAWTNPTTNQAGEPLAPGSIANIEVKYGFSADALSQVVQVDGDREWAIIGGFTSGQPLYVRVVAISTSGLRSDASGLISMSAK